MRIAAILFAQGFGTRRDCEALVAAGAVRVAGRTVDDPGAAFDPEGLAIEVRGEVWPVYAKALVVLNKPAGYECSQRPGRHPSVMNLLPPPLRRRGVQPVGRLDADTTGLLLLTDDGALIHRLTSPKTHVAKVYEVETAEPVIPAQIAALLQGVVLRDDARAVRAAACTATGERTLRLTLHEGKYHQVKRMVAAANNRVVRLHRSAFGALALPADLAPGAWRWLAGAQDVLGPAATR